MADTPLSQATTSQQAVINLGPLLSHAPTSNDASEAQGMLTPADTWQSDELQITEPLAWHVQVHSTGGDDDYILSGSVQGQAAMACRRCLHPVLTEADADFVFVLRYEPSSAAGIPSLDIREDDEEEYLAFTRPQVDVSQMLIEIFLADLPLTVACEDTDACQARQAAVLGDHPNPEPSQEPHSPFAALKDLQDTLPQS